MIIERALLQSALRVCKPGLADKSPVMQFLYYWFGNKTLTTYNDVIGIELPLSFETDFACGMPGALLSGLIDNSRAKNADITFQGGDMVLKLAGAKAKLATLPEDQAVWHFPAVHKKSAEIEITPELLAAFKHAELAFTTGTEYSGTGICLSSEDKDWYVYSSDGKALTWTCVGATNHPTGKVCLPRLFCDQLVERGEAGLMYVADDHVIAELESGLRVFSRLIEAAPLDYRKVLDRLLPEKYWARALPIPGLLKPALDRVGVLSDGAAQKSQYKIVDGKLVVFMKTPAGELHEKLSLEGKHAECESWFDSGMIRKALGESDRFFFTEDCFVLLNGKDAGYIATVMA